MFYRKIYLVLSLIVFAASEILSQGGPPMITDDPYPVEKKHWEFNLGLTGEFQNSTQSYQTPLVDLNYGITDNMHLKFETPIVVNHQKDGSQAGLGKSSLGVKWLIYENTKSKFGFGIFPALAFNIVSSSVDRGLSEKGIEFFLPVSVMKTINKTSLVLQAGRVISDVDNGEWHYGFLMGFTFSNKTELAVELAGSLEPDFTGHQSFFNAGLRYGLSKTITLLFSGGRQLVSFAGEEKSVIVYLGTRISF